MFLLFVALAYGTLAVMIMSQRPWSARYIIPVQNKCAQKDRLTMSDAVGDEDNLNSIINLFDSICLSYGDQDAILIHRENEEEQVFCYLELQELSLILACQLHYRHRPDYVLVDCFGHVIAETVTILACLRLGVPFVPVSVLEQHSGEGRLTAVVRELQLATKDAHVIAICCCENDQDPVLGVFYNANIHCVAYLDASGNIQESLGVPQNLPQTVVDQAANVDDMYVLFTSGTSTGTPKAVIGSQSSTFQRLQWFLNTFESSPRVARRTRLTFVGTSLLPSQLL